MKFFLIVIFGFVSNLSFAGCFIEVTGEEIKLNVEHKNKGSKAGGNHGFFDVIKIEVLSEFKGAKLEKMLLTKGEVAEFWYPIAFKVKDGLAATTLQGYTNSVKNLEMVFQYADKECTLSTQVLL